MLESRKMLVSRKMLDLQIFEKRTKQKEGACLTKS